MDSHWHQAISLPRHAGGDKAIRSDQSFGPTSSDVLLLTSQDDMTCAQPQLPADLDAAAVN